jgi:N-acylneuraminate cytidylyltransferase
MERKNKPQILAIIPARGGSKGIPRKNIRLVAGKPLITHTIEQSLHSKLTDRTIVSTDSETIKSISEQYSAEVIERPKDLAGDTVSSELVIEHAINVLNEGGFNPDIIVFLQCTSPLRRENDIDDAIKLLFNEGYDSVFSVTKNRHFIWRGDKDHLTALFDYKNRPRRQDRNPEYIENGSIYVFRREIFKTEKNRICGKRGIYVMPYEYSFEIDEPFDFWLCEQIIKRREK